MSRAVHPPGMRRRVFTGDATVPDTHVRAGDRHARGRVRRLQSHADRRDQRLYLDDLRRFNRDHEGHRHGGRGVAVRYVLRRVAVRHRGDVDFRLNGSVPRTVALEYGVDRRDERSLEI
ncbi:MAG TPA: hypothetical protein VFN57_10195 [Thermomicrobiaceae bacterium]|nr:hypothetical protein [Thermomicrobiaceae bacterium]